jgi:hypothetical protein
MQPALARRRLKKRLEILDKISCGIKKMFDSRELKNSLPLLRIMEHNLCLLRAEATFLSSLLKKI